MTDKLIVFLRRPVKGKVKSRLAKTLGEEKALEIYRWLLDVTFTALRNNPAEVLLYFDSNENDEPICPDSYKSFLQKGETLGERMINAFSDQSGEAQKIVMIGSDCPEMNQSLIQKAFDELDNHNLVLGPASDGGVYLIGIKGKNLDVLHEVPWESSLVFDSIISNAGADQCAILPMMKDIDYEEDFKAFEDVFSNYKIKPKYA